MAVRLLDTNIVSYLVKRHPLSRTYRPHLVGHTHVISFQTLGELFVWGRSSNWGPAQWADLQATLASLTVLDSESLVCEWWAEVRSVRRSQPIGVADAWIAATALAYGLELVTHNPADFAGIPGLVVVTEAP